MKVTTLRNGVMVVAVVLSGSAFAGITTVDFSVDDNGLALGNGQMITNNDEFFADFTLSASGPNAGLAIFDSTSGVNSADEDLWVNSGNLMVFQNSGSSSTGDFYDTPNDDADGGTVLISFNSAVELMSIDLADINGNSQEVTLTMFDSQGFSRIFVVPSEWTGDVSSHPVPGIMTLDLQDLSPQPGFGSTATITFDDGINMNDVVSLEMTFQGSGGFDNLAYTVPAPSALCVLIGAGICARRRRRG